MHKPIPRSKILQLQSSEKIRIYSYQTDRIWDDASLVGYLSGKEEYIDEGRGRDYGEPFWEPYNWMREQMNERLSEYSGDYPVWGWAKRQSERGKNKYRKRENIRIIADVPVNRVLMSNFETWHSVLNRGPICYTENEYDNFHTSLRYDSEEYLQEVRKTWTNVFDVTRQCKSKEEYYWIGNPKYIQLCIDRIYLDEIVDVRYFG